MKRVSAPLALLPLCDQARRVVRCVSEGRERVLTSRIKRAVVMAGFLLWAAPAGASLTVTPGLTVSNRCNKDIVIAVYYKDSRGNWTTTSFTSIRAGGQKERVASSDNSIFYYYAESTTGSPTRWSGDRDTKIEGKTYPMKEKKLNLDRERNRFLLELTCTK